MSINMIFNFLIGDIILIYYWYKVFIMAQVR